MALNNSISTEDLLESNVSLAAIEEAQSVVEDIAALNGVFTSALLERAEGPKGDKDIKRLIASNSNLKEIASRATQRLAEDLNDKPTHFVSECIQNADDNDYPAGIEPFLRLSVSPQCIQLDCNENGFKEEHVRAICSVGKSTKSKQKVTEGHVRYIGEKGIGFKSVFKVAERVYVHSPPISFMFDKRRELGMITPLWVPEGEVQSSDRNEAQTAILLLPNAQETYAALLNDFISIPSTLLLFLRKIKKLELVITNLTPGAEPTSIHKTLTSKMLESGKVAVLIERDVITSTESKVIKEEKYYIFEQVRQVTLRGEEERRKGVKKTELALAFPVNAGEPCDSTQPVHAFLPIRDFGFKFLIQADFILTANRQDVEQESVWNEALRNYVAYAFKDAIIDFAKSPNHELRYTWMRFLPTHLPNSFLKPIKVLIKPLMCSSKVLESRAGTLHCPPELYRLPAQFKDRFGCPIVSANSSYLSPNYKEEDLVLLKELGVEICSPRWFLGQLYLLGGTVKSKPVYWHEDLARSLLRISETSHWADWSLRVKQLPLIPLQDGTWAFASQLTSNPIYFRRDKGIVDIPADINLRLVDSESSANTDRERFFRLLGVKDCDKEEVAKLILRRHQDDNSIPQIDDSIAHVKYLYALDPTICDKLDLTKLWLYDEQGNPARGHHLYVRSIAPKRYSAATLFESRVAARYLSASYGSCLGVNGQSIIPSVMQLWLEKSTTITDIPRLTESGRLSHDFEFILEKFPNDVLHILKAHWTTYKYSVDSLQTVKDRLSSHEVRTFDGVNFKQQKLSNTFAPDPILQKVSSDLCSESRGVFFLYFDSYKPSDWDFLKVFGVKFSANLIFYDWLVRQPQFRDLCTLPKFKDLLRRMALLAGIDSVHQSSLRKTFARNNIFIPKTVGGHWTSSALCVWGGPIGFKKQRSIKQWYKDDDVISTFLQSTLGIQDATADAVIEDLTSITPSDKYLKTASAYLVTKLKNLPISDASKVRCQEAFRDHAFLSISGSTPSRVKSTSCFWGDPDFEGPSLSFKHDLQCEYQNDTRMSNLCRLVLRLQGPSWDDLIREIKCLKDRDVVVKDIGSIYAYMFQKFSRRKETWELILAKFEREALVLVPSSSGNRWKRPSECVWQTPITLRCKCSLKDMYSSSDVAVLNLLQKILSIGDAGVAEYMSELAILSANGNCSRDEVERLYRHIELQWNGMHDRSTFGLKRLILNHKEMKWVSLDDCIWYGPDCIKLTTKLEPLYPSCKKLFVEYLGVGNFKSTTFTCELSGLQIPDPENISADNLNRVKGLLLGLNKLIVENPEKKLPVAVKDFLKSQRVWPRRYIGLTHTALVNLTHAFFVPDHPLLLELLKTTEDSNVPILDVQFEEASKVKQLLLALGIKGRSLSLSKKETVSATDMSDPADDLTEDLQKRAQALFYCAVHYETTRKLAIDDLLKKLRNIRVYRTPNIFTKYDINSQGIETSVVATGYLRMAEEDGYLRVFVPDNESLQRTGYSNSLSAEMIRILQIPEYESWQAVSALLTSEPDVDQLALILSLHGIHHKLNQLSLSGQEETNETVPSEHLYEEKCETRGGGSTDIPASGDGDPLPTRLNSPFNSSLVREEVTRVESHEKSHGSPQGSTDDPVPEGSDEIQALLSSDIFPLEATHTTPRRSPADLAAMRSRLITEASVSTTSIFTVASHSRDVTAAADPVSKFDLSSLATALPSTPPKTPDRRMGAKNTPSRQSGSPPARTSKATTPPPPLPSHLSTAPMTNPHRYDEIDIIGYAGEQFVIAALKQHLPDFQELMHWTSKLRTYAGFKIYDKAEVTDLTYPDTQGLLSKFILDNAEEGSVPGWLKATRVLGSKSLTYFLEVKTTTGACDTPFIISRNQFRIMEEKAITGRSIPNEVYVILRVYQINSHPQIKIYLDPWNSKDQQGGLQFTVKEYYATPIST